MQRIKYRRTGEASSHQDYWKSFTDVFATVCLVFFFVMVVFGILSSYLGNSANLLMTELQIERLALRAITDQLDDRQRELLEAEAERIRLQLEFEELQVAFQNMITMQLAHMAQAREDFESIAVYRVNMYRRIEAMLQEVLGDQIYYDEEAGTLIIGTDILFAIGLYELTPEHMETINLMRPVLFAIIDEYTHPDSLVRFESFEFRGHTDRYGHGHSERLLSQARARSIVNALLPIGSPEEARYGRYFIASGASMFQYIAGTLEHQTPAERAANRRVEIIINFDDREIERAIADIANTLLMPDTVPGLDTDDEYENEFTDEAFLDEGEG